MDSLKNQFAEVKHDQALNIMHVTFNGYVPHEEFVKILEFEFDMVSKLKLTKCLIDLRKMAVYAKGNESFIKDTWYPGMKNRGLKHIAFVVPESVLGKMSMNKTHSEVKQEVLVDSQHFASTAEAISWLKTV